MSSGLPHNSYSDFGPTPHLPSADLKRRAKALVARKILLVLLPRLSTGYLTITEGNWSRTFGDECSERRAELTILKPQIFWEGVLGGSPGLAKAWSDGAFEVDDLVMFVRIFAAAMPGLDRYRGLLAPARNLRDQVKRNSRADSKGHIEAHYDLGNGLFQHFLDPTLTYSCAVFEDASQPLHEAQINKLDLICRKLELKPGERLVEIGSGWGALAMHAAQNYGVSVTTVTLSQEQHAYVTEQLRQRGLDSVVEVQIKDYRDLRGKFDKLVSIEMIEAVGWQHFDEFFAKCDSLLKPDGLMLIQAITVPDKAFEVEKSAPTFIRQQIFPGGCLPSLQVIANSIGRKTDLQLIDLHDIGEHYGLTLLKWREAFLQSADALQEQGYDYKFRRTWELYLAWCEGGFIERRISDVQLLFAGQSYRPRELSQEVPQQGTPNSEHEHPLGMDSSPAAAAGRN